MRSPEAPTDAAVSCDSVVKQFRVYTHRTTSLREWFIRVMRRRPIHIYHADFLLSEFNLRVLPGESVALIGPNGCGKSTVLRLIAGIYSPTSGTIRTIGRVAAVIELGAGFNQELTGAENIELYASIMGLTREQLAKRYGEIVEFAGIPGFMNMPVKYYSSGMQARLAFSVAINIRPEILLMDEVLAVGDEAFQRKCLEHLQAFRRGGGTLITVSHDLETIRARCTRAVWLDHGRIRMAGEINEVVEAYLAASRG